MVAGGYGALGVPEGCGGIGVRVAVVVAVHHLVPAWEGEVVWVGASVRVGAVVSIGAFGVPD